MARTKKLITLTQKQAWTLELYRAGLSNTEIQAARGVHPLSHGQMKGNLRALQVLSIGVNTKNPAKPLVSPTDYTVKDDDDLPLFLNWKLTHEGGVAMVIAKANAKAWLRSRRSPQTMVWSDLAVLADALQDIDFSNDAVLTFLRAPTPAFPTEELMDQLSPRTLYPYSMNPPVPYTDPRYVELNRAASATHSAAWAIEKKMRSEHLVHDWRMYRIISRLAGRVITVLNGRPRANRRTQVA